LPFQPSRRRKRRGLQTARLSVLLYIIVWLYLQKKHEKGSPDSQVTSGISDLTGELNRLRLAVRFGDCQSATIMDQLDGISWMDPAICWVQFCPDACRQRPDRKRKTTRETATAHPLCRARRILSSPLCQGKGSETKQFAAAHFRGDGSPCHGRSRSRHAFTDAAHGPAAHSLSRQASAAATHTSVLLFRMSSRVSQGREL
jgi:hypothetical protein